jgi:hypothetical protein
MGGEPPELLGLVRALAPLVGKAVRLCITVPQVVTGAAEVEQLGVTLGSSLKTLDLWECELSDDFWPAVWAHLPGLQQLWVGDMVHGATSAPELAAFCARATRPLQLNLDELLHDNVSGILERQCQVWGVPQVTIGAVFST